MENSGFVHLICFKLIINVHGVIKLGGYSGQESSKVEIERGERRTWFDKDTRGRSDKAEGISIRVGGEDFLEYHHIYSEREFILVLI